MINSSKNLYSDGETESLKRYQTDPYKMNTALRDGSNIFCYNNELLLIDSAIKKKQFEQTVVLFRATCNYDFGRFLISESNEQIFSYPAYMSTTLSKFDCMGNSLLEKHFNGYTSANYPILLTINCEPGYCYAPIYEIFPTDNAEQEVLLGRDCNFKVIKNCTIENSEKLDLLGPINNKKCDKLVHYELKAIQ